MRKLSRFLQNPFDAGGINLAEQIAFSVAPLTLVLIVLSQAHATDVVHQRFSEGTLAALAASADENVFTLSGRRPDPLYNQKTKTLDVKPILSWLQEQQHDVRQLAPNNMEQLRNLILVPRNHQTGLFAVADPAYLAVSFTSGSNHGFIVLGYSLVTIIWDDRCETALLNDRGIETVQQWTKENG